MTDMSGKKVRLGYKWVEYDSLTDAEKKESKIQYLNEQAQHLREQKRNFEGSTSDEGIQIFNELSARLNGVNKALREMNPKPVLSDGEKLRRSINKQQRFGGGYKDNLSSLKPKPVDSSEWTFKKKKMKVDSDKIDKIKW